MINMHFCDHVKYRLFFLDINETWIFLDRFSKNTQVSIFIKILAVEAELVHADRRTFRHDEANCRFSQLRKRDQKYDTSLLPISMPHTCMALTQFQC
jgi:hypothetical protein